jgi:predicted nuclease of predicted toxin-antitoxin system
LRIKLDENLGNRAIKLFREARHEVATVSEQDLGASDDELIETCGTEGRVLVTLDLDFSNVLRFPPGRYAWIAVLRVPHPIDLDTIRERVRVFLKASEQEDLSGRLRPSGYEPDELPDCSTPCRCVDSEHFPT